MSDATDREPINTDNAVVLHGVFRQMTFLADQGMTLREFLQHAMPTAFAPTPECPVCGTQWRVRSSRPANVDETIYQQSMDCHCRPHPTRLVDARWVRRRKKLL
jgi:hypothetical protein